MPTLTDYERLATTHYRGIVAQCTSFSCVLSVTLTTKQGLGSLQVSMRGVSHLTLPFAFDTFEQHPVVSQGVTSCCVQVPLARSSFVWFRQSSRNDLHDVKKSLHEREQFFAQLKKFFGRAPAERTRDKMHKSLKMLLSCWFPTGQKDIFNQQKTECEQFKFTQKTGILS